MDIMSDEKFPVSESLKVIDGITQYKTEKWWSATLLLDSFGRKQVAVYLWLNKDGDWKRQQKFVIHNKAEWALLKDNIENYLNKLQ